MPALSTLLLVSLAVALLIPVLLYLGFRAIIRGAMGAPVPGIKTLSLTTFRNAYLQHHERATRVLHNKYGPWFGFEGTVVIGDPAIARQVLLEQRHTTKRHPVYRDTADENFGKSVGVLNWDSDDKRWPVHTRALLPVFHASNVAQYAPHMHAAVTRAAERILTKDGGSGADIVATMRGIAADVLMTWGYGLDPESKDAQEFHELLIADGGCVAAGSSFRTTFNMQHHLSAKSIYKGIHDKLASVWTRVLPAALASQGAPDQTLNFARAMKAADIPSEGLKAQLVHIFGAHKAIGLIMAFCLYELTRTPSRSTRDSPIVERIRKECDDVLQGKPYADKADVSKLVYLRRVLDETTRMHPVVGVAMRTVDELKLSDSLTLPTGSLVGLSLEHLHFDPASWEEPEVFNPDRFLKKPVPGSFVPFLLGKRMCAGMPLAIFEFMCCLSSLLMRFDVEVSVDKLVKEPSIYTGAAGPVPFRLTRRV